MEPIPEFMTPVFLFGEKQADGGVIFHFDIPPQSPTVQGLACILATGLNGCKPEEILSVPADFFAPMNLQEAIDFKGPVVIHAEVIKEDNVFPMVPAGKSAYHMIIEPPTTKLEKPTGST